MTLSLLILVATLGPTEVLRTSYETIQCPIDWARGLFRERYGDSPPEYAEVSLFELDIDHDAKDELFVGYSRARGQIGIPWAVFERQPNGYRYLGELWFRETLSNFAILPLAPDGGMRIALLWHISASEASLSIVGHDGSDFVGISGGIVHAGDSGTAEDRRKVDEIFGKRKPEAASVKGSSKEDGSIQCPIDWAQGFFRERFRNDPDLWRFEMDIDHDGTDDMFVGRATQSSSQNGNSWRVFKRLPGGYRHLGELSFHADLRNLAILPLDDDGGIRVAQYWQMPGGEESIRVFGHDGTNFVMIRSEVVRVRDGGSEEDKRRYNEILGRPNSNNKSPDQTGDNQGEND